MAAPDSGVSPPIRIRPATPDDAPVIARHRANMFRDMGQATPEVYAALVSETESRLREALASGEYVGWLALSPGGDTAIGGAGAQRRLALPHPQRLDDGAVGIARGRHAIVLNVYTDEAWRRRGVAEALMRAVIRWAREEHLDRLVLHASEQGRPLYERLGFAATNEMRFQGPLGGGHRP